jgi:hypothetical protein
MAVIDVKAISRRCIPKWTRAGKVADVAARVGVTEPVVIVALSQTISLTS